jgi:serine/threonine-protein kinase RsbW
MATVDVSFTPLPAHVRTARLVATAVARRGGVPDSLLDEVRLAVGEACSRAVEAHQRHCPSVPVHIRLTRDEDRFEVTVTDAGSPEADMPAPVNGSAEGLAPGGVVADGPSAMGLAVIAGLADDVQIARTDEGLNIQMTWSCQTPADTVSR